MTVAVCIPWRSVLDRVPAHQRVVDYWTHHGFDIFHGDTTSPRFNISAARNIAVATASADISIVADADTIPDIAAVWRAIERCADDDGLVDYPFTQYRHIPGDWTAKADLLAAPVVQSYTRSVGGLLICQTALYWTLGGMDERFTGWGYEDSAFHAKALTLARVRRENAIIFSFDHAADRNLTPSNPNRKLYQEYRKAFYKANLMKGIVDESNAAKTW